MPVYRYRFFGVSVRDVVDTASVVGWQGPQTVDVDCPAEYLSRLDAHMLDRGWVRIDTQLSSPSALRIYGCLSPHVAVYDPTEPPIDLNYTTGLTMRLHPVETFDQGTLVTRVLYAEATHDTPIVREDIVYVRDALGFAQSRVTTIAWYRNDGSLSPTTKALDKVYTVKQAIIEGQRRRRNIVTYLEGQVSVWLTAAGQDLQLGRDFVSSHNVEISTYVEVSSDALLTAVSNDPATWLDLAASGGLTIRQAMMAELDIWS